MKRDRLLFALLAGAIGVITIGLVIINIILHRALICK